MHAPNERKPDGRFLLVLSYAFERQTALRFHVARGCEVDGFVTWGWLVVVEDPEPDRYAPFARNEDDDCA